MSRKPSHPYVPYPPDQRYWTSARPLPYSEFQGTPVSSNQQHPPQELPRFLLPDSQGYDPTIASRPHGSWLPPQGRPQATSADSRYIGSLAQHGVQRASPMYVQPRAPGGVEHFNFTSSHHEPPTPAFGYGRGSVGSAGWSNDVDSQYSSSSVAFPSPVHSDNSAAAYAGSHVATTARYQPQKQQQEQDEEKRASESSTAMGLDKILHHSPVSRPPRRPESTTSRYHLHIRQQPIAARACGAGDRDRRPVDPPPIVQMLLTDFDPSYPPDLDILQDPRFAIGCLLYPAGGATAEAAAEPTKSRESRTEDNLPGQSTPLLSGKAFVSPFFVDADPDPSTAPPHPAREPHHHHHHLGVPRLQPGEGEADRKIPSTFFIFSDLSVRTAGLYRFQFRLMNWGNVEDTGQSMPILAEAWSEPFRVYPAKDFPGMRDSSALTEGLKEMGFVELKTRGKGKGKGRRR